MAVTRGWHVHEFRISRYPQLHIAWNPNSTHNTLDASPVWSATIRCVTAEPTASMDDLIAAYAQHLTAERMLSARTVARYRRVLVALIDFLRDATDAPERELLLQASEADLVRFLASGATLASEPSRSTWNLELAAVRSLYGFIKKAKLVDSNPTDDIERHRIRQREVSPLSFDEMLALVDAARASGRHARRNTAIIGTLFHSALRVAELVSLDRDNVDSELRVFREVRTKGDKLVAVAFNDVVAAVLDEYLAERDDTESALFLSDRGTRLSVRSVQELVQRLAKDASLARPVYPHLLRHSSATALAGLGTHITVIQDVLGHASITTTQRYVHLGQRARRDALDALGRRWKSVSDSRAGTPSTP